MVCDGGGMHLDHLDHEIRAARATQRDRWRREQGLPPETPETARSDAPPPLTSWEDLGNEATRAADERDVAEAVERAIEERDRRRRGMLFTTALGAGILGHTLVGATRSIGRALQRWGSGEHSLDELMGVPPETRARRAQMRGDERLARRIQREERIAAMSAGQPNYAPPMGTRDNPVRFDGSDEDDDDAGGNPNFVVREWRTPFGNFRFAVNRGASDGNGAPPRLRTTQGDDVEALLHRMMAGGAWGGADNGHDVFAFHEWMRTRGGNSNSSASDGNNVMGMTYEQMMELAEQLGAVSQGVSAEVIDTFPTWTYRARDANDEAPCCSVCLCDAEDGDTLRTLPCMHTYHKDCIDKWLGEHRTCPVCKHDVRVDAGDGGQTAQEVD